MEVPSADLLQEAGRLHRQGAVADAAALLSAGAAERT